MGGPGFGDPMARDPERVAQDVRDGYRLPLKARETYGVALNADGAVDQAATNRLREGQKPAMSEASSTMQPAMAGIAERLLRNWDRAVVPLIFLVMVLAFFAADPNYLSATNIINVLNQVSILSVVAVGRERRHFRGRLRSFGGGGRGACPAWSARSPWSRPAAFRSPSRRASARGWRWGCVNGFVRRLSERLAADRHAGLAQYGARPGADFFRRHRRSTASRSPTPISAPRVFRPADAGRDRLPAVSRDGADHPLHPVRASISMRSAAIRGPRRFPASTCPAMRMIAFAISGADLRAGWDAARGANRRGRAGRRRAL